MSKKIPKESNGFAIRRANQSDAFFLATLMTEEIHWGRLRDLGQGFITLLHRHMVESKYSVCLVGEQNGEILGYAMGATEVSRFYREFLFQYGLKALAILSLKVFRPRQFKTILRGLTYIPSAASDDPQAEILSFAVRQNVKRSGVGSAIFHAMKNEFKRRGIPIIKVGTVDVNNEVGNQFYLRNGCILARTEPFHGESLVNVYMYKT